MYLVGTHVDKFPPGGISQLRMIVNPGSEIIASKMGRLDLFVESLVHIRIFESMDVLP